MQYFKNVDLTKMYPVSEKAVRNWISAAKEGKLELALYEKDNRHYIANVTRNFAIIDSLVEERRKYANSTTRKTAVPDRKFYEIYNDRQILDIISSLEIHNEIPFQYTYFNGGAEYWDKYANRLFEDNLPSTLTSTINLLSLNLKYIESLIKNYRRVNIVDVGVGNALPARDLLQYLLDKGVLGRYIALDLSDSMLQIAEKNVHDWFDDQVGFEGYVKDINYDRFNDTMTGELLSAGAENTITIVLLFGGTIHNLRAPHEALRLIHDSMRPNDILLHSKRLDTETARRSFDLNPGHQIERVPPQVKTILDLMGISESYYDFEQRFDGNQRLRKFCIRLKTALTIEFKNENIDRKITFDKGHMILCILVWHHNAADVYQYLDQNHFNLMHASQTEDHDYLLTVSRIKTSGN